MASLGDLLRAQQATPAESTELVGPPAPPKKTTLGDLLRAQDVEAAPPPAPPKPGEAAGAFVGGTARREEERAQIPEYLRRPEEEEPPAAPRPDEAPPLLRRPAYEEAPAGAYGKPTRLEEAGLFATRVGVPVGAGIVSGALSGPGAPVVGPLVGAATGTAAELAAEKYEKARGFRKEVSPYGVMWSGALNAIPGLPLSPELTVPARIAARTAEGATVGLTGTTGQTLLEEGRLPTKEEALYGAGMGAAFGAGGGTFEAKGVPYLHERSAEFVGPREGGVMSRRQVRAADEARATSVEQLAGETTMPPVGEPGPRMVTQPGETIGPGGEPAPGEFVGPPAPEMQPHPVGSDVNFRELGEQERTTPGRIVGHAVDPESGETRVAVEDVNGAVRQRPMTDVELAPGAAGAEPPPAPGSLAAVRRSLRPDVQAGGEAPPPAWPSQVQRFEEPGVAATDISKPHGLYTSPIDVESPHAVELGGERSVYSTNPDANVLHVDTGFVRTNRGFVGESAGIAALRALEPERAPELLGLSKRDLVQQLSAEFPSVDWGRYADQQGMLEGYAGLLARQKGYDAIWAPDREAPHYSEFVGLTDRAFVPPGGELPPPPGGEAPGAGPPWEAPPEEIGPYGQRPTFRKYPGLGEALTGEEIGPQLGADPERMTRAIESVDREFGDVFDEPTRDRLKQQIRDNQNRFEYLGRGKQTMERTQGLGRDLLFDLEAAKLEPKGTVWNPEQTAAAKNHVASLDQGLVAAQEAFDANPTPENGLILQKAAQDQVDAFMIYRARGAEAGRTVNLYKASAEELASGNQRLMMAALRRGVPPDKLADIIRSTKPEDVQARAEMLMHFADRGPWHKRLRDTMHTIFISNILSGPPPHERNILGNGVNALLNPLVAKPAAAFHERFLARLPPEERTVYLGEVGKHFVGMWDAWPEAVQKAAEIVKRGYTTEQAARYVDLPKHELGIGRHPLLRAGLNIVPRGLGAVDMFFRVLGQEASLNGQSYTKARTQALIERTAGKLPPGMSFTERLSQLYDHHRARITPEMMEQSAEEAARGVYQERDKIARAVTFARDNIPGGGFVAPFVTTQTNVTKQGLHYFPGVGYLMPSTRGKGVTPRTAAIHKGEALAGTVGVLLGPLALWAAGGKLHGSGPDDPKANDEWRRTHVPNSIELGGHMMSVQQFGPLAIPLVAVGNAWDKYDEIQQRDGHVTPEAAAEIAVATIGGTAQSVLDQPYMQGISNFVDLVRHIKEPRYWSKFFKDIGTGFIPGAGMLRWAEQIQDPTIRQGKTLPEKFEAGIPYLSKNVPPKLDVFGEPVTIEKEGGALGRALIPIDIERVRRDPLREELARQGILLSPPGAGTPAKGEPPYTPKEALIISKAKGQQVRAELEDLIASDAYQEADPEERNTMLKSVLSRTRGAIGKRARGLREEGLDVESLRWE